MSVQLFCSQIAVVASRPAGWTTRVTVAGSATDESSMLAELVGLELVEDEVVGDALVLGAALVDAGGPPAAGVPAVGAAQATVKTAVDRSAAAAMPWRRFTSDTFESRPAGSGRCGGMRAHEDPRIRHADRTANKSGGLPSSDVQEGSETQVTFPITAAVQRPAGRRIFGGTPE